MRYTQFEDWAEYKKFFTDQFTLDESYVVCGVGEGFHTLRTVFPEVKILYCLDAKEGLFMPEWEVYPYKSLSREEAAAQKFIITPGSEYYAEIKQTLLSLGAAAQHIISLQEILFFWGTRYHERLYSTACNIFLLTNCNLKCKGCSQFTPYIQHHRYNNAESVKENLDLYFQLYDYVKDLILIGGETMLYRELGKIGTYISSRFSGRYHELRIYTNGLITPEEEVLAELSAVPGLHVYISDYTCSIEKNANQLIAGLERHGIDYTLNSQFFQSGKESLWFDLGDPTVCKCNDSFVLRQKFENCSMVCQNMIDHKIYYCVPACAAIMGEINVLRDPGAYLDCDKLLRMDKQERTERIGRFSLGFLEKGYLEFCRYCNGYGRAVNTQYIKPGEQA